MTNYSLVKTANSAKGSLAGGISANQGTLSLLGGEGGKFPTLGANEYFYITVTSQALATNTEIMRVTARNADTLTITQADGTARNLNNTFSAGDSVEIRTTANSINDLFDLDNILPNAPTQPNKFGFRNTNNNAFVYRSLGSGIINFSNGPIYKTDEDVKFAIKSDGTNSDYVALAPDDISEDNNTSTGYMSLPVRGHPYLPYHKADLPNNLATEVLTYTALNAATNSAATYSTKTSSDDNSLYAHAEDHDIPISEGSLVYLANVVSDDREVGAFGEWITANTTNAVSNSTTVVLDTVRRTTGITGAGGSFDAIITAPTNQWVGKYLLPVAGDASDISIPPGTHVVECTIANYGLANYAVTLTLNNNVTIPQNNRIQFHEHRKTQLGTEMSASQPETVYYKRNALAPASTTVNGEAGIKNAAKDAYMPVSGRTCNMYMVTSGQGGTAAGFTASPYYVQLDTNDTNGPHTHLSVKCKPLSVNSVFSVRLYCGAAYHDSSYASFAILCDFMDNDPQPNNTREFKNPNDNTVAKAVVMLGRHMANDRYKIPEFNDANPGAAVSVSTAEFLRSGFSNGRLTPGTWPDDTVSLSQQPQSQFASYYGGNHDNQTLDAPAASMDFDCGNMIANAIKGFQSSVQFFRPGVTDFIRFRVYCVSQNNSGTVYFPYPDYGQAMLIVEEHPQPEGMFGFDIPGGLDTTAHWNGTRR